MKPGGYLIEENKITGAKLEFDTFTCVHCNRMVVKNPKRQRPRNECHNCNKLTCDSAGCIIECNPFERDLDRAKINLNGQPWLLRGLGLAPADHGFPVDAIYDTDGKITYVLRKDNGMTERERTRRYFKVKDAY